MEEKISIQKEKVLTAYKQASKEQKALLENMFGKDMFNPKNIMERVKTFEDACAILGDKHRLVKEYLGVEYNNIVITKELISYLKLRIIVAALNEGWKPKFDGDEYSYYPWFYIYTKEEYEKLDKDKKKEFRAVGYESGCYPYFVSSSCTAMTCTNLNFSARLTFRTPELAIYCGCQFTDIWSDYLFG